MHWYFCQYNQWFYSVSLLNFVHTLSIIEKFTTKFRYPPKVIKNDNIRRIVGNRRVHIIIIMTPEGGGHNGYMTLATYIYTLRVRLCTGIIEFFIHSLLSVETRVYILYYIGTPTNNMPISRLVENDVILHATLDTRHIILGT